MANRAPITLIEAVGDKQGISYGQVVKGELLDARGEPATALPFAEQGIHLWREIGDRYGLSFGLIILAHIVAGLGDRDRAEQLYVESLSLQKNSRNRRDIAEALEHLASLKVHQQQYKRSATLLGAAMVLREEIDSRLAPKEMAGHQLNLEQMRAALGEAEFRTAWADGRAMNLEQAIAYAKCQG